MCTGRREKLRHSCPNNQQVVQDNHRVRKPLLIPPIRPRLGDAAGAIVHMEEDLDSAR